MSLPPPDSQLNLFLFPISGSELRSEALAAIRSRQAAVDSRQNRMGPDTSPAQGCEAHISVALPLLPRLDTQRNPAADRTKSKFHFFFPLFQSFIRNFVPKYLLSVRTKTAVDKPKKTIEIKNTIILL